MTPGADPRAATVAKAPARALPLVLVHGYLGGAEQWAGQLKAFSDLCPMIPVELPGFGHASADAAPETIGGFADHVIATLDAGGIDRFVLLGHSMGGMIAQEVAHRVRDRVERLVLYGTGPLGRMPDRFEPLETSADRLARDGVEMTARRIVSTWFVKGDRAPGFQLLARIGATASAEAAHSALHAMANWDGRANLARLTMPTLILWGDRDRSYRWPQIETLWTGLPDPALAVVPNASHAVHLEKPEIFEAILRDYLTS